MFSTNELKILESARYTTECYIKYEKWSLADNTTTTTNELFQDTLPAAAAAGTSPDYQLVQINSLLANCVKILSSPSPLFSTSSSSSLLKWPNSAGNQQQTTTYNAAYSRFSFSRASPPQSRLATCTEMLLARIAAKGSQTKRRILSYQQLQQQLNGWHPLHLAALVGNQDFTQQILDLDPDSLNGLFEPLGITPLMCAGFGGHPDSMNYLISRGAADLTKYPEALVNWTIKGGNVDCCRKILIELNVIRNTSLNLCSLIQDGILKDHVEILKIILERDGESFLMANVCQKNQNGDSVLLLAVEKGLVNCLKLLIRVKAPINDENKFGQSALHKAILSSFTDEAALKLQQTLIYNGAHVNHLDRKGHGALRYAANKSFSKCVFKLINNGAHITLKDLDKLNERIPHFVEQHLNGLVSMKGVSQSNSKILVAMSLRLTGSVNNTSDELRETSFLRFLIHDGQNSFLTHPVIETFLTIKWIFVRKYFILATTFYILLLVSFTLFVLEAYVNNVHDSERSRMNLSYSNFTSASSASSSKRSEFFDLTSFFRWLHLIFLSLRIIYMLFTLVTLNFKICLKRFENWIQIVIILTMALSHVNPSVLGTFDIPDWQNKTTAVSILLAWIYILHYVRRQPTIGIYVEMLIRVFTNIAKLLLTYTCMLIGFAISFMVLYKKKPPFTSTVNSLIRVLNMMVGEINYDKLFENNNNGKDDDNNNEASKEQIVDADIIVLMFYAVFIISITIGLVNLLIGLAVTDIKNLRKRSRLQKLMREVTFISDLEEFLNSFALRKLLPTKFHNYLQRSIHLRPSHHTVFIFPNDTNDRRLHKELKLKALAIAIQNQAEEDGKVKPSTMADRSVEEFEKSIDEKWLRKSKEKKRIEQLRQFEIFVRNYRPNRHASPSSTLAVETITCNQDLPTSAQIFKN